MYLKRIILGLVLSLLVLVFPKIVFIRNNEDIKFGFYADRM